jgi:hypothetical protein
MLGLLGAVALALAATAAADRGGGGSFHSTEPPLILHLEGVLAPTEVEARTAGFATVALDLLGREGGPTRWLGVTEARTVTLDHSLDGKNVLAIIAPVKPNLLVTGPAAMVAELRDAPAASVVAVEGLVSRGSRTCYLRNVTVAPPAAPPGR